MGNWGNSFSIGNRWEKVKIRIVVRPQQLENTMRARRHCLSQYSSNIFAPNKPTVDDNNNDQGNA
jgi:hypothetical protein